MSAESSFDYIVIGAGSAGCVVANRLSAAGEHRVLLLEAGKPDKNPAIHEPDKLLTLWGSEFDWNYLTEPQPGLNNRAVAIARGKVLGGSSSLNAMIYIRGNRRDFDHWRELGNEGWGYDEVLPLFKKSENYAGDPSEYHGTDGPMSIVDHPDPTPVAYAFAESGPELGYAGPDFDFNGAQHENGTGLYQYTLTRDGKRASTATAFLKPILNRSNLSIETGAHSTQLLFEGERVVGVEYFQDGQTKQARADSEVVLCCGTFDSPRLLMLSGIGPAEHLRSHGIEVKQDLAGVGQNMQDHLLLPVWYKSKRDLPLPKFIAEAGLFVKTKDKTLSGSPDLQYHFSAGKPEFINPNYPVESPNFAFVPILVQPESKGTVTLRSADPHQLGVINPNYLQEEADVDVLVRGITLAREIAATQAMGEFSSGEAAPGLGKSDEEMRQFARNCCSTVWHVAGTCKMGSDEMAVVDAQLKVRGVQGLRVADASIMPTVTSGNTNAACIMIGEKVAELILEGN